MIPAPTVTAWSISAPWPSRGQVEQDLLLSRLIIEIANHPYLGGELVFRGGTCLHKLQLRTARRYSEDLDYVRTTAGGIKDLTVALGELGADLPRRHGAGGAARDQVWPGPSPGRCTRRSLWSRVWARVTWTAGGTWTP